MILAPLLALSAAFHPTDPTLNWPQPPREMVDFLGRRRLCLDIPQPTERTAADRRRWARLSCATLPQEERDWRSRYGSNEDVRRWLELDPSEFQMPTILVSGYDGPPPADARHLVLSGRSFDSGSTFRLSVDQEARHGRYTTFTASFADLPPRTFVLDNERFPNLDLQSIDVAFGRPPPSEVLIVELRFGYLRGYCSINEQDDRPEINIRFSRSAVEASYQDRTNCRTDYQELPNARSSAP